jgi:hypothetical protein
MATAAPLHLHKFFFKDLVAKIDAFITDINAWARDQLAYLLLRLSAKRALQVSIKLCHRPLLVSCLKHRINPKGGRVNALVDYNFVD